MKLDTGKLNTDENIFLKFLSVREGGLIKLVDTDKMTRICFEEGFSFLYAEGRRFLTDKSLNDYEKILEPKVFFRTSRTDIVNISLIDSIHPVCNGHFIIELKDKSKIPLSRRRAKELRKILNF
ncbi:MAG TPA: LytTR family DNA-binding domain-containing protein [Spirochaetota bacterium]|nr:LytTR family DNA-binding domain-containing protein [Spirochaetota bacterium]